MGHMLSGSLTTIPVSPIPTSPCPASPTDIIYGGSLVIWIYHLYYKSYLYYLISWQRESTFCSAGNQRNTSICWNCQKETNTLCASSNFVLLTSIFHLSFIIQSWFTNPSKYISLQPDPHGFRRALQLHKIVLCFFSWFPPSLHSYPPHSTPSNHFAYISSIYLINASAICQHIPGSFNSMFSRLEFSERVEKERTKDWDGRERHRLESRSVQCDPIIYPLCGLVP